MIFKVKVIMDLNEKRRILRSCHSEPTSGHFGITKTWKRISERFYWKSLSKDVQEMVHLVSILSLVSPIVLLSTKTNNNIVIICMYMYLYVYTISNCQSVNNFIKCFKSNVFIGSHQSKGSKVIGLVISIYVLPISFYIRHIHFKMVCKILLYLSIVSSTILM